jgi:DNA-binding transcriptional ArsR family regulator
MDQPRLDQPLYVAKAELFRSLGHPIRIRILELLVTGESPVSNLLSELGIEPSSLSQHLNILKHSGLVESTGQRRELPHYRFEYPRISRRRARGPCLDARARASNARTS